MSNLNLVGVSKNTSVLFLPVVKDSKVVEVSGTNHIMCCDVSYSMYNDLPLLRSQIKNKIPDLMKDGDSLTIIWFSGRGEAGVLKEKVKVKTAMDLKKVHDAIDKFVVPVGATSFLDPIELANKLIDESDDDGINWNFLFFTDGYNNSSSWTDINASLEKLAPKLSASSFVEYGFYADSDKLSQMAEITGGQRVVSQSFDEYEVKMESILNNTASSFIEIDVTDIKDQLKYQFAFAVGKDGVSTIIYSLVGKKSVKVSASHNEIYLIMKDGGVKADVSIQLLTMKILFSKGSISAAEDILFDTGDISLIEHYNRSFGKQNLNQFHNRVDELIADESKRFISGFKSGYKPKSNAYCILDLVNDLGSSEENLIFPNHEKFIYKRMSAKRLQKGTKVLEGLKSLKDDNTTEFDAKTLSKAIKEITATRAQFKAHFENPGVPISNFTWNSDRANLSLLLKMDGEVTLPKNEFGLKSVEAHIFRNYNIIKDGVLNFNQIPVKLNLSTLKSITKKIGVDNVVDLGSGLVLLNIGQLPTINKTYITKVSANNLADQEVELLELKAKRKCLDYVLKSIPKGPGRVSLSDQQVTYLATQGIRDGAFSPLTEKTESLDVYIAVNLLTKIEKFSSLPSIDSVLKKKLDNKKLTISDLLIDKYMTEINSEVSKISDKKKLKEYLNTQYDIIHSRVKELIVEVAQSKFSLILSRRWFNDLKDGETSVSKVINGETLSVSFEWKNEEVKI